MGVLPDTTMVRPTIFSICSSFPDLDLRQWAGISIAFVARVRSPTSREVATLPFFVERVTLDKSSCESLAILLLPYRMSPRSALTRAAALNIS